MELAKNPFPFKTKTGKTIVGELCTCGHNRNDHGSNEYSFGHGPCLFVNKNRFCECVQYTWSKAIFA